MAKQNFKKSNRHFHYAPGYAQVVYLLANWADFLEFAGDYAQRLYLYEDLQEAQHNPRSDEILRQYYSNNIRNLQERMKHDKKLMEERILKIAESQRHQGLGGFRTDEASIKRFIDYFSKRDLKARERRAFYRRIVNKELNQMTPQLWSLDALEAAFKESKAFKNG